jgi:hypothetical protein
MKEQFTEAERQRERMGRERQTKIDELGWRQTGKVREEEKDRQRETDR